MAGVAATAFLSAAKYVVVEGAKKGFSFAVTAAAVWAANNKEKVWIAFAYSTGYGRPQNALHNAVWYVPIRTKRLGNWIVSSVRDGLGWAGLTNPKIAKAVTGPGLEAMSNASGIPEPAVKTVFQLAKEFATSPLGVTLMIAGAILRSGVPISPVFKKFLQKGPGSGFRETCRYVGRVMNYYLGLDDELQTLIHNKMGLKSPKSPNNPPAPVKLTPKSPNKPVMVSQMIQTSPMSPSPNYIYVGGRKIPLRRKPMSPAKAKEGRLRKVVRHVLHGRTEEEKMMKLAKALRKRALAASARSRSASAARSRSASA